jgi:hypothetical protein
MPDDRDARLAELRRLRLGDILYPGNSGCAGARGGSGAPGPCQGEVTAAAMKHYHGPKRHHRDPAAAKPAPATPPTRPAPSRPRSSPGHPNATTPAGAEAAASARNAADTPPRSPPPANQQSPSRKVRQNPFSRRSTPSSGALRPHDLPSGGGPVAVQWRKRRWRCRTEVCPPRPGKQVAQVPDPARPARPRHGSRRDQSEVAAWHGVSWPTVQRIRAPPLLARSPC